MKKSRYFLLALLIALVILSVTGASADVRSGWLWPVPASYKNLSRGYSDHKAIDISIPSNTPVYASKSGTVAVVYSGCRNYNGLNVGTCASRGICSPNVDSSYTYSQYCNFGFGNGVIIRHDDGSYSSYAHMTSVSVSEGATVSQGQEIGRSGSYGCSTGPHLHFTIASSASNPRLNVQALINNNPKLASYGITVGGKSFSDSNGVEYIFSLEGYLDVNGYLDGNSQGGLGSYGTVDVYINGTQVADDVSDYYAKHPNGTSYEIKDIKANAGYEYLGIRNGSLTGTIGSNSTSDVRLSFATQGNLYVRGLLDGSEYDSIDQYGTFDVYINGKLDEKDCISYNKQWPNGTTYQVTNIRAAANKIYEGESDDAFSGTIESNVQDKVLLTITTKGTATVEWQTGKVLPPNLDPSQLDVEYQHTYVQESRNNPGEGWVLTKEGAVQYENDGGQYNSDNPLETGATRVLVGYYYFHWCDNGSSYNANYYKKDYLPYYHMIPMSEIGTNISAAEGGVDGDGSGRKWYSLTWLTGQWAGGKVSCCTNGTQVYYQGYVYQNKKAYQVNTYQKTTDWTEILDSSATSHMVRWRWKGGQLPVPPEKYVLTINGRLDNIPSASTDGYAVFDLYIDGELFYTDITGFSGTFAYNPTYDIQNIRTKVGKKYDGLYEGNLNGDIPNGTATVTLAFSTVMDISDTWTETDTLSSDLDLTGCEVEYKNHYVTTGRTSPGDEWTLYAEGAVQYENDGAQYNSDDPLTTSATRVLVGHYYYHWCDNGASYNANYYKKDYLPYYHTVPMSDIGTNISVAEGGTDGDGSGRKWYSLTWLTGQWAGGKVSCCSNGTQVYYQGNVYQNKKAYRINTYVRDSDWTNAPDPAATSVSYRVRLKRYDVILDANGGTPDFEFSKLFDQDVALSETVPEREDYIFAGWNSMADGSGTSYDADFVYSENAPLTLYAQWEPLQVTVLPNETSVIEEEAFENTAFEIIRIPYGCTWIDARAFANCRNLHKIYIPSTVIHIDSTAFDGIRSLIIVGAEDTIAELYASKRDWITFKVDE